ALAFKLRGYETRASAPPLLLRRPAPRADHAARAASLHAEPRRAVDGQEDRPLRRLLPVLVRRLDGAQPDPARPGLVERLRQGGRRERALALGNPRGGREAAGGPHRAAAE